MTNESTLVQSEQAKPDRNPYRQPQLLVYGNIREMTQAVGNGGAADNGIPPNHKTQV